jgi:superfamily II DNA helicase RecQ
MCPKTYFKFDSPAGRQLCNQILKEHLPFTPHNDQLEGVTAIIDRQDFIGVSATGSGKSVYAYMVLHVIQSLQA